MTRRIDAHHHLWDAADGRQPMLSGPPVTRFWGRSDELPRCYDIDRFLADAVPQGVVASVYVEAAYEPAADEAAAIQRIADRHGFPQAILTRVGLGDEDAPRRIAAAAAHPNWRGIRITAPLPAPGAGPIFDEAWHRGFAALADHGGVADLMLWPPQLGHAAEVARRHPATPLVIEHFGLHDGDPRWDAGMAQLAACPNVAVKLSGPGLVRRDWSAETIRPIVARLVSLFGADRLMIGSNAPVDLVMADYAAIVARFDAAIADLPAQDRAALWHDTAARIYRIAGAA